MTTQESTASVAVPLPVELVIPATTQESVSNIRVPLPEKLVIPAIPHNSDNSARDDMEPEERLPVPGVDNSNVMVYPPLKSKTIVSSEFPIAGAPPLGFQGQQLPPVGTQQPFGQPPPPVWPQSLPPGYGFPPPGYQVQGWYAPVGTVSLQYIDEIALLHVLQNEVHFVHIRVVEHFKEAQHVGVHELFHYCNLSLDVLEVRLRGAPLLLAQHILTKDLDCVQVVCGPVLAQAYFTIRARA